MASLSDQIDRLTHNTRAIKATTAQVTAPVDGPFTRAVLSAHLGDLIRDIDPSELGLFSLPESEITRAEFTGATPLKKPQHRREDVQKSKEIEPEIYAEAALKCIDRYNAVRPMPRAHSQVTAILERLTLVRQNIQSLTVTLQQTQTEEEPSLKSLISDEEKRVRDLQTHLAALQERKKNAVAAKTTLTSIPALLHPNPKPKVPPPPSSPQEDSFWNTPGPTTRALRFTDNLLENNSLMDDQTELGDISMTSFATPMPVARTARMSPFIPGDDYLRDIQDTPIKYYSSFEAEDSENEGAKQDNALEEEENEKTVILRRPISGPRTPEPQTFSSSAVENLATAVPASDTPNPKQPKVRINSQVEHIVTKIWATIGEMIMPGHPFDTAQGGTGTKPPRAKETIVHLQLLYSLSPSPTSPSVSSVSSLSAAALASPTSQQILTAHMLLSLLANPPQFSLPLNKVKDLLAAKGSAGGGGATGTTRILYGCVAKRLVKIDRSGGEQIVKFDI